MMDLREQVARAICKARYGHLRGYEGRERFYEREADAAIAAVLEAAEITWEVWEDDLLVASSTEQADALHYLKVYSQDADVVIKTAFTVRMNGARSAFASEHGVEIGE